MTSEHHTKKPTQITPQAWQHLYNILTGAFELTKPPTHNQLQPIAAAIHAFKNKP